METGGRQQSMRQTATAPQNGWSQISMRHFVAIAALAIAIGIIATIEGASGVTGKGGTTGSDLLGFFFPSAQNVLDGHPFSLYAVRFLGYPNYNPPLSTLLMAPLLGIGQSFLPGASACVAGGYSDASCDSLIGFVGIAFIPFVVLLGVAALAALRRAYPAMSQSQALLAFALIMLSPLMWQNFTTWWHFEQPMMLFFFVAGVWLLQGRRVWLAGVLLGLALLTRTTAAVPLVALLTMLVVEREWNMLGKLVGAMAAIGIIGIGPFFLRDRADAEFSLLTWRGTAPIGNSIWSIFIHTPLEGLARHLDLPVALLAAVAVGYFFARQRGVTVFSRQLYAVLALAALLVPMLSKTVWPYYYAEPFVFLVLYEFSTLQDAPAGLWRWPAISLVFLGAAAMLSQFIGLPSATSGGIVLRLMGLIDFASMLAFAAAIWQRFEALRLAGRELASEPASRPGMRPSSFRES
jgi:hypothetical protein